MNKGRNLAQALNGVVVAYRNCQRTGNTEWADRHRERINVLERMLPRGSGFDAGTRVDIDASSTDRLVINTEYHRMDEYGGYDGWVSYTATVTPAFLGALNIDLKCDDDGEANADLDDYVAEELYYSLIQEAPEEEHDNGR